MSSPSFDFLLTPVTPTSSPHKGVTLVNGLAVVHLKVAVAQAVNVSAVTPRFRLALITPMGTITCNGYFTTFFALDFCCHVYIMPCKQQENNLSQTSIAGSPLRG